MGKVSEKELTRISHEKTGLKLHLKFSSDSVGGVAVFIHGYGPVDDEHRLVGLRRADSGFQIQALPTRRHLNKVPAPLPQRECFGKLLRRRNVGSQLPHPRMSPVPFPRGAP